MSSLLRILLPALLAAVSVQAASPRELVEQGNQHYAAGRYAEALQAYQQAEEAAGGKLLPELLHNQAAAQFKLGRLEEARELWVRALGLKDAAFEARIRYNLGNCNYAEALRAEQSANLGQALEALDRAIEQYRDALKLDPGLLDARANLELAYQLRQQLQQAAAQSQPSQSQPGQQQSAPESQPGNEQPPAGQQGQQDTQPSQPQSQEPTTQPSASQPQTAPSADSQPQEEQAQEPTTLPSEPELPPVTQPAPQGQQPEQEQAGPMTRQEAERLLQLIRDMEKARREMLRQRERLRHKPVDKDW